MKKWLLYSYCSIFLWNMGFSQETTSTEKPTSDTRISQPTHTPNMDEIAQELEKTGALVEKVSTNDTEKKESSLQDLEKEKSPTLNSVLSESGSSLIQYDAELFAEKLDPYPLEAYSGSFLEGFPAIREAFADSEKIQQVKASLDRWYQNDRANFPLEAYLMLSAIYDQLQNYSKARAILDEGGALADIKQKVVFEINKSQIFRHAGQNQPALDILNQLETNTTREYPEIFLYKALSYLYLKDNDLSILNLRKYLNLLPKSEQNAKVRRAIAWLILNRSGRVSDGNVSDNSKQNPSSREQDLEKMLQLLVDKQLSDQVGDLIKSTNTTVDTKALDIQEKELEDLADYSDIVD